MFIPELRWSNHIKVSVLLITYNHEKFIAQALDSVLMQRGNFDYEIIISEDCSTDSTRNIVIDFQKKYSDKIRLLLSEQNLNSNEVIVRGIKASQGKYIALLDGDDYWISPYKLQKQVDFLDSHPEYSICFHNAKVVYEDESQKSWNFNPPNQKQISTIEDLWTRNFIATCSVMFRKDLIGEFPNWYYDAQYGDWGLHILNAVHGKIGYINEVMGIYRIHSGGVWSKLSEIQKLKNIIKFYEDMNANLKFKHHKNIMVEVSRYYYILASEYKRADDLAYARVCAKKAEFVKYFIECPFNKQILNVVLFKILLRLYTPLLHRITAALIRSIRITVRYLCW